MNKGHEFDEIGHKFKDKKRIFIYGAGKWGEYAYKRMAFLNCVVGFIDGNIDKQKEGYCGLPVYSLREVSSFEKDYIIVIAVSSGHGEATVSYPSSFIMSRLIWEGYKPNEDFFKMEEWLDFYFRIYAMYAHGQLAMHLFPISVTEKCTLRCEKCNHCVPFIKHPENFTYEEFCNDIDLYFKYVDYVFSIDMVGGELFCNPDLYRIMEYVAEKYLDRIFQFNIITNGTIVPKPELLDLFKKYKINVVMSDYRKSVPQIAAKVENFISAVAEAGLELTISPLETWYDYEIGTADISFKDEEDKIRHFDYCSSPCRYLRKGRFYYCTTDRMAQRAELTEEDPYSYFDMNIMSMENRMELLEFDYGFNERGYPLLCAKCNGSFTMNKKEIEKAVQYKG